jgi:hypothetical protein
MAAAAENVADAHAVVGGSERALGEEDDRLGRVVADELKAYGGGAIRGVTAPGLTVFRSIGRIFRVTSTGGDH